MGLRELCNYDLYDEQSLIQIYPNDVTDNPEVYSLVVQKTWIQTGNLFL